MLKISHLVVPAFRFACEAERIVDGMLHGLGWKKRSFSQKRQDRWIMEEVFPARRGGYFVELGGGDGRTHSNTYVLERDFAWYGIVIEPNPHYAAAIARQRRCRCVEACVDGGVREVEFLPLGYLGGVVSEDTDYSQALRARLIRRRTADIIRMRTKTLDAILQEAGAPSLIDYLSIDVEGAEYRILRNFPFDRYRFLAMTIERPSAELHQLLSDAGYVLVKTFRYDGFYVAATIAISRRLSEIEFRGMRAKFF